ncbi:MAG: hypothetical protein ACRD18_16565 [Terriglobia bacterium]
MALGKATANEIYKKLREDFRRQLKNYGDTAESTDPVLAALFRTFASQLESQYQEVERLRLALLDELITGLGIERRTAHPAQTVVRFPMERGAGDIDAGTELLGESASGEKMTFTTDASLSVSTAAISLALTYQGGAVRLLSGVDMPETLQSARPSLDPVKVNLGANPAIFLAIEGLPESHLSQHGFFFELGPDTQNIQDALRNETWCLVGPDGELGARGILRPRRINAGVRTLAWLLDEADGAGRLPEKAKDIEVASLPDGFYAGRVVVFPVVPAARRYTCRMPRGVENALARIFGRGSSQLFDRERAWLRISMPREISDLETGVASISLHSMSASNVECFNETINFERQGTSIPVSREAGTQHFLVAPLSVFGAAGSVYLPQHEPSADEHAGRYSIRNGRIDIDPARHPDNSADDYVNLRLWITQGKEGNAVGPGQVRGFLKRSAPASMQVINPTSAAGGTNEETAQEAQARFAEALLSRDRIVTRADLAAAVRAFDRRILKVEASPGLQRSFYGLERVQRLKIWLPRDEFLDREKESAVLQNELASHLEQRFLYGTALKIDVEWK